MLKNQYKCTEQPKFSYVRQYGKDDFKNVKEKIDFTKSMKEIEETIDILIQCVLVKNDALEAIRGDLTFALNELKDAPNLKRSGLAGITDIVEKSLNSYVYK